MSERDEIVITGMSINTPRGDTLDGFIDAMYEGRSALSNWHSIDASRIYLKVGADLGAYDLEAKLRWLEERTPHPFQDLTDTLRRQEAGAAGRAQMGHGRRLRHDPIRH